MSALIIFIGLLAPCTTLFFSGDTHFSIRTDQRKGSCNLAQLRLFASENNNLNEGNSLSKYFEEKIQRLRFGYEADPMIKQQSTDDPLTSVDLDFDGPPIRKKMPLRLAQISGSDSPRALCFTGENERPRGCEPLLSTSMNIEYPHAPSLSTRNSKRPYDVLPCIANGICPYIKFRCARGHEWKAIPNSPVCLYCPQCKTSKTQIEGIRVSTNVDVIELCTEYILSLRGHVSAVLYNRKNVWKSNIQLQCSWGHSWIANPTNLLLGKTWCRCCRESSKSLSIDDLHTTAQYFGGEFLGFSDSQRKEFNRSATSKIGVSLSQARWRCGAGHTFVMSPNNIRRRPGNKRKCSWCRVCRKNGIEFKWDPIL